MPVMDGDAEQAEGFRYAATMIATDIPAQWCHNCLINMPPRATFHPRRATPTNSDHAQFAVTVAAWRHVPPRHAQQREISSLNRCSHSEEQRPKMRRYEGPRVMPYQASPKIFTPDGYRTSFAVVAERSLISRSPARFVSR